MLIMNTQHMLSSATTAMNIREKLFVGRSPKATKFLKGLTAI